MWPRLRERRLADPVRALAAHLWVKPSVARSIVCDHVVAADAGIGARARPAPWSRNCAGSPSRNRGARVAVGDAGRAAISCAASSLVEARREFDRSARGAGCGGRSRWRSRWCRARRAPGTAACRSRPSCRCRPGGSASRRAARAPAVSISAALLLDDHDRLEAGGEGAQALRLDRPGAGELIKAQPDTALALTSSMPSASSAWRTSR